MSSKENLLGQVYYIRAVGWFRNNVFLNRLVCGSILLFAACVGPLSLHQVAEDKNSLFLNVIIYVELSTELCTVLICLFTIADDIELQKKVEEFKSLRSEVPKTYDRITRTTRKLTTTLWVFIALHLFYVISIISCQGVKSWNGIYRLTSGYVVLEGLTIVIVLILSMFPVILLSRHARWTYYLWVQTVLLGDYVKRRLGVRIHRDNKEEQELCKRYLREVVRCHSVIKSIADYYYRKMLKMNAMLLFIPGVCTVAAPVLVYFTDVSVGEKLLLSFVWVDVALFTYITLITAQWTIDESENLCKVLYECPWYDWDKSNCATLIIIMSMMKKPLLRTEIFGVVEVNKKAFLKIFRVSYGLATGILS